MDRSDSHMEQTQCACSRRPAQPPRVDAVITWVDGADPVHRAARADALRSISPFDLTTIRAGIEDTRFTDNRELRYCIRAIRAFIPWVDTIHLVTAGQVPSYLTEDERTLWNVRLVDHKDIFAGFESVLPTFNSRAVETVLHRINGLAEHFLYFNDDFVLLRPMEVQDFFTDGKVVVRGTWEAHERWGRVKTLAAGAAARLRKAMTGGTSSMHVVAQARAASIAGLKGRFLKNFHVPWAVRKSTLVEFFRARPELLRANIGYRFRNLKQFNAMPLATHLEIAGGTYHHDEQTDALILCFGKSSPTELQQQIAMLQSGQFHFLCVQDLERASPEDRGRIEGHLDRLIERAR